MQAFVIGWCLSSFWAVVLVPILIVKNAFNLPLD